MRMFICLPVFACVCLRLSVFVCVCLCLYAYVCMCVCMQCLYCLLKRLGNHTLAFGIGIVAGVLGKVAQPAGLHVQAAAGIRHWSPRLPLRHLGILRRSCAALGSCSDCCPCRWRNR